MTESSTTKVRKFSGISPVWIVPLLALAVALWMVWQDTRGTGPTITVAVGDAEGIEAGKTQVKVRNVDVGQVTEVRLSEGFSSVQS